MKLKNCLFSLFLAGLSPCLASTLEAAVVVTYSIPSANTTALAGASVFNFNSLPLGLDTNVSWSGVGTFNKLDIVNPNIYGGATDSVNTNGTRYSIQGKGDLISSTTLTLTQNSGYFGIWLSAADTSNVITLYENGVLVANFTTATLLADLGSGYDGNPRNRTQNAAQPYVFVNFFGDVNTKWNSIVLTGTTSTASLESDNYASRVSTYNPNVDGSLLSGAPVERVDGNSVTVLSPTATGAALWGSSGAAPGAPAPSIYVLAIFGLVFIAKSISRGRSARADA